MPLLLGFVLVSLFIWFAENIGTVTGAWLYPHQMKEWSMVPFTKLGAWFLLMIISCAMIAALNRPAPFAQNEKVPYLVQPDRTEV